MRYISLRYFYSLKKKIILTFAIFGHQLLHNVKASARMRLTFPGKVFINEDTRNQYAWQNRSQLIQRSSFGVPMYVLFGFIGAYLGIIGSGVFQYIFSLPSTLAPMFMLLGASGAPTLLFIVSRANRLKINKCSDLHFHRLIDLANEIRSDTLEPFYRRYHSYEERIEKLSDLQNLIFHKKNIDLSDEELSTILKAYEKSNTILALDKNIKKVKHKHISTFVSLFADIIEQSSYGNDLDIGKDLYFEALAMNNIHVNSVEFDRLLAKEMKQRQADDFEQKLKRSHSDRIDIEYIDSLDGFEFEEFCKELFERMGYHSEITPKSGDQGADLIIKKSGTTTAVQTKNYSNKVSNKAVQEVIGAIKYYDCDNGMVVTNAEFTKSAQSLALRNNIELVNREQLVSWLDKYY